MAAAAFIIAFLLLGAGVAFVAYSGGRAGRGRAISPVGDASSGSRSR